MRYEQQIGVLYTVVVTDPSGREELFAMDSHRLYGPEGPMYMQAVTSDGAIADKMLEEARENAPKGVNARVVRFGRVDH